MQRRFLATLFLVAVVVTAAGCQQTAPTIAGGPAPAGQLAPVNPSQQPILGPLGGNTRVTPPATGSYQQTGGYIGASTAPIVQPNLGAGQNQSSINPAAGNPAVGLGVQVAGFTETNSMNRSVNTTIQPAPTGKTTTGGPRSGGMHVNDLTGAPAPPGYRPVHSPQTQQFGPGNYVAAPQSVPNAVPVTPGSAVIPSPQPVQRLNVGAAINPNPIGPNAGFAPAATPGTVPSVSQIPAATTTQGPSTEPIAPGSGPDNLMWRRPDSNF